MSLHVDWRNSVALTGTVVKFLAVALLVPLLLAIVYGEDVATFLATIVLTFAVGTGLERFDTAEDLGPREAFLFVGLAWFSVSLVGAVPYVLAGHGTESTLAHPVNALFESTSGFTTTGATVMGDISLEQHSHALLMWRQLTQWLGGMGIIVLMVAIFPELAVNGAQLMDTEAPGPTFEKLTPRISETAQVLWKVYFGFTVLLAVLLYGLHLSGLAPNMGPYNAVAHAFSTLPTGGFSPEADSIAAFSPVVQWTIIPFMIVAGTNFALFWFLLAGRHERVVKDPEFRAYIGAIAVLTGTLAVLLFTGAAPALPLGGATNGVTGNALRQAAFQIGSLMNSTGFATSDFAQWSTEGKVLLLFAMFIGGSAGSTGSGIKVVRWLVIVKAARRSVFTTVHPEAVKPVRLGGTVIDEDTIRDILVFSLVYFVLFAFATVFIALDANRVGLPLTPLEAISGSLATLGNIGPGFGRLGPFGSYLALPSTTKLLMVFLMWAGRLEIIPVLLLFTRTFWRE
ncbi:TrkH family potassium uptake protein [Halorarum salinum]|uniref:TrkH family potassium uptake protein n=1 Tax=Halorarum salinum TaxID=2743089 RepID=A0A7D5QCB1_9EURY|nr:TrkH family potassium uptake protein [Halobaculum salinum]QLG62520.1 TrkH family potassium uptake protein [Halobaculum salinum]